MYSKLSLQTRYKSYLRRDIFLASYKTAIFLRIEKTGIFASRRNEVGYFFRVLVCPPVCAAPTKSYPVIEISSIDRLKGCH